MDREELDYIITSLKFQNQWPNLKEKYFDEE